MLASQVGKKGMNAFPASKDVSSACITAACGRCSAAATPLQPPPSQPLASRAPRSLHRPAVAVAIHALRATNLCATFISWTEHHLDVACINNFYFIKDSGSKRGTYVKLSGSKSKRVELHKGMTFAVGKVHLKARVCVHRGHLRARMHPGPISDRLRASVAWLSCRLLCLTTRRTRACACTWTCTWHAICEKKMRDAGLSTT